MIEMNIRKSMAKVVINTFCNLIYALENASQRLPIVEEDAESIAEAIQETQKLIDSFKSNHSLQLRLKTLATDQEIFQSKLEDVQQVITSIRLMKYKPNMINIDLCKATKVKDIIGCSFSDNLKQKLTEIEEFCNWLSDRMDIVYSPPSNISLLKLRNAHFIFALKDRLECIDQIRADMQQSLKGEQEFIKMKDGSNIDTMWIPNEDSESSPTVMFCNPNGAFYETFAYDGAWLDFYSDLGFNIFLWNYRGYGRSTGQVSPSSIISDANELVTKLKSTRGIGKLLIHGISLGGGVACHLSHHSAVTAIFADRTFSSLDSVVKEDFSKLHFFFNLFTLYKWRNQCADKFSQSTKYKIVSCDPKDEMIPELSSLK